ncbi:MAG TPA: dihydrofolate reductase family protein [Patescibacteria group bacterium]
MRKIIVLTFLTLDGVMQAPGAPNEDTSGDFKYGGWQQPFADEYLGKLMSEQMSKPFDLLLGRITYDIFSSYWPKQTGDIATLFNKATKFVVTHSDREFDWEKTVVVNKDIVEKIKKLKTEEGPDLQIYGSGNLVQTLLKNSLVDNLWLKIYPITIGSGKKLFAEGTIPKTWKMTRGEITPNGVIIANYESAGDIKTGTMT